MIGCNRFTFASGLSLARVISVQVSKVTKTKIIAIAEPTDTGMP